MFLGKVIGTVWSTVKWPEVEGLKLLLVRPYSLTDLGGFNQTLYAGEEIDLFRRLKRLAREKRQTIAILHRHPLYTSDRKARLYTSSELMTFLARTIVSRGRTLRSAEACFTWYDGRR